MLYSYFNPRTPCGVRQFRPMLPPLRIRISIHAPHAGCDYFRWHVCGDIPSISIHAPHAGCDHFRRKPCGKGNISIHAPHAGCDLRLLCDLSSRSYFNPRTPCGVRHLVQFFVPRPPAFQSTHPMRGATHRPSTIKFATPISIHAPHAGCDSAAPAGTGNLLNFNPRTPCGVRPGFNA